MHSVLVTGANGFVGQHLVRSLLDDGSKVRCLIHSDLPLYFFSADEVEMCHGDLTSADTLAGVGNSIDTVYHLAAIPRNDLSKTWDEFVAVNVRGTETMLRIAANAGVRRFVYVSTVEAAGYGDGTRPRGEEDHPRPVNNYGRSKLEAERVVQGFSSLSERTVIRLPMIYGPGTPLIVPKLFGAVKKPFYPLIGSGNAKMEFCYVGNAVQGIRLCGEKEEAIGELFYVSDARSYALKEVVREVGRSMGKEVRFLHLPTPLAYSLALGIEAAARVYPRPPLVSPYSKKPIFTRETVWWTTRDVNTVSTDKIRSRLGYQPQVSMEEGCRATAQWINEQHLV